MKEICFMCGEGKEKIIYHKTIGVLCNDCYSKMYSKYQGCRVYRFISPEVFFRLLEKEELMFTLPSKWKDTFEDSIYKLFLDARRTCLFDPIHIREVLARRDFYYCQCWTFTEESKFFWETYGYENRAIRIEIDLADAFDLGIRIEPVLYAPFLNKEEWIEEQIKLGMSFVDENESNIFCVNEDGCFVGDYTKMTGEMCYARHIISSLYSIHERKFCCEPIPLPAILATKQTHYVDENEVRFFIRAYDFGDMTDEYFRKHEKYVKRIFSGYNDEKSVLDTHMPNIKNFSFASNKSFIKSILCHPNMSEELFTKIYQYVEVNGMLEIFRGKSRLRWMI